MSHVAERITALIEKFRRKGFRNGLRYMLNSIAWKLASKNAAKHWMPLYPRMLHVSVATTCNLRCANCIHGYREQGGKFSKARPKFMSFEAFKELIDQAGPYCARLSLTPDGEAFLNPDIYRIIRYAAIDHGIRVEIDTNGHFVDVEALLDTGLAEIVYAVDGFTQQSYEKYRRGGNLATVIRSIEALALGKLARGAGPEIRVKYLVNAFTEDQLDTAREHFAKLPSVKFFTNYFHIPKPSWTYFKTMLERGQAWTTTKEMHDLWAPKQRKDYDIYYFDEQLGHFEHKCFRMPFANNCQQPFEGIFILTDGDAFPCCVVTYTAPELMSLGNVFLESFRTVFNGERAITFRRAYLAAGGKLPYCATCWANRADSEAAVAHGVVAEKGESAS